ncbi:MAG: hypothetical protein R2744_02125 [Bacteroidales bacterium]
MNKKILFLAMLIIPVYLSAQDTPDKYNGSKKLEYGIGAAAGFSTGYGLSFRYWPSDWGIQLTTAPYYTKNDSRVSIGASLLRTLNDDSRIIQLYVYYGNHLLIERWSDYYYDGNYGETSKYTTWITGIGPGFEFTIAGKVSFNLMFGIASYTEFSNNHDTSWMLNMTAETGLYYKF